MLSLLAARRSRAGEERGVLAQLALDRSAWVGASILAWRTVSGHGVLLSRCGGG